MKHQRVVKSDDRKILITGCSRCGNDVICQIYGEEDSPLYRLCVECMTPEERREFCRLYN